MKNLKAKAPKSNLKQIPAPESGTHLVVPALAANDTDAPLASVVSLTEWLAERRPMRAASVQANHIYALADWDPADPPGPGDLLGRLLGPGYSAMRCHERPDDLDVRLVRREDGWLVLVPAHLGGASLAMAIARAIARWYLAEHAPASERSTLIDDVAAAIVLPDAAIARAVAQLGWDVAGIAEWLVLPLNVIAGRLHDAAEANRS